MNVNYLKYVVLAYVECTNVEVLQLVLVQV